MLFLLIFFLSSASINTCEVKDLWYASTLGLYHELRGRKSSVQTDALYVNIHRLKAPYLQGSLVDENEAALAKVGILKGVSCSRHQVCCNMQGDHVLNSF
jgi:hypothetical protein